MAKAGKKKSGFHKDISSVLKGVAIPQGVRNWRPPDRIDDSSAPVPSNISSVFKSTPTEPDSNGNPPAELQPQNHDAERSPAEISNDRPTSRSSLITKLDCPEDSLTKAGHARKSEPEQKVVSYHDPLIETSVPSVGKQLQKKSVASKKALGKKGRKALVLSAPVLIIIIILIHRYCFRSAPQETEASASSSPPPISTPEVRNDVEWQVPELLPARVMDFLKDPEEEAEQKKQNKGPAKRKKEIDLRAILFSDQKPSAVVDGQILHIGDKVSDAIITNITKDSVEFENQGRTWSQKLRR